MRNTLIANLTAAAGKDDRIFLVVGDLGYSVIEDFAEAFPNRYLNAGVSEQNMVSVAAGLAREGYKVFAYSIGNFATLRCLEQIRNDVCYHKLPVTMISIGGGFMYGSLGATHHATEDIAVMRALPNMSVYVPFSKAIMPKVLDEVLGGEAPAYIRIGREGAAPEQIEGDGLVRIRGKNGDMSETAFITVGKITDDLLAEAKKQQADVYALYRVKPLPEQAVKALVSSYRQVCVVEDHQRAGGAFSALSECISPLKSFAISDSFASLTYKEDELRNLYITEEYNNE